MPEATNEGPALRLIMGGRAVSDAPRTEGDSREGPGRRPRVRSIAVASGKGGVGKTSIATNLAVAFARRGKKVLLVDGDLSLANIDLLLGVAPSKNLTDLVLDGTPADQVVMETSDGVRLLPAGTGVEELADLDDFRREKLLRELSRVEDGCDLIVLDTGSGIGRQTMHLVRAADQVLVVTTPEPTAFSDAYATLKVLSHGRLCNRPGIVVNMVASAEEGRDTEQRIRVVAERFLSLTPEYFGCVPLDPCVGRSVRQQEPLLRIFPDSPAAVSIETLADRLLLHSPTPEPRAAEPEGFFSKAANMDGAS